MALLGESRWSSVGEVFGGTETNELYNEDDIKANIRCAIPAVVESYNPTQRTIVAQPTIMEVVNGDTGTSTNIPLPLLQDVPVVFPAAGGFQITFPINIGDECLIIFADRCIDGWWQNSGIQVQQDVRLHDLSDGFAIFGPKSLPNLGTTSTTAMIIDGPGNVLIKGLDIVTIDSNLSSLITAYNSHTHTVQIGTSTYTTSAPNNRVTPSPHPGG